MFDPNQAHKRRARRSKCGDSKHVKVSSVLSGSSSPRPVTNMVILQVCATKSNYLFKSRNPTAHQLQAGLLYVQEDSICSQSSDLTYSIESFCLQVKIQCTQANTKFPKPHHLITNLAYRLKPHHKWNQYLRARSDISTNVNIMPVSVYKLVFQDPDCKKLASSKLEIGTYTTNTVKLVCPCMFYLVHEDAKHLIEVTFYVTSNNVSVLLSYVTILALAWFNPTLDWIIFHPEPVLFQVVLTIQSV